MKIRIQCFYICVFTVWAREPSLFPRALISYGRNMCSTWMHGATNIWCLRSVTGCIVWMAGSIPIGFPLHFTCCINPTAQLFDPLVWLVFTAVKRHFCTYLMYNIYNEKSLKHKEILWQALCSMCQNKTGDDEWEWKYRLLWKAFHCSRGWKMCEMGKRNHIWTWIKNNDKTGWKQGVYTTLPNFTWTHH